MVYNILNDEVGGKINGRLDRGIKLPQIQIETDSFFANLLINLIKCILFVYDLLSLPVYFIIQRPDKNLEQAQRMRSERVDINTWIKTDMNEEKRNNLSHDAKAIRSFQFFEKSHKRKQFKYMGSTMNEVFANSIREFSSYPCLGYRAVVTCPIMTLNEEGESVLQDKSFRSDYTWYTFDQIGRRVQDIASGLYHHSVYPESKALFLATAGLEWFCVSQACFQLAVKVVVAPDINDDSSLRLILREAEIEVLFASCDKLNQLCKLFARIKTEDFHSFQIKKLILIDWQFHVDYSEPTFSHLRETSKGLISEILSVGQIEESGAENSIELSCTKSLSSTILEQDQYGFECKSGKFSMQTNNQLSPEVLNTPQRSPDTKTLDLCTISSRRKRKRERRRRSRSCDLSSSEERHSSLNRFEVSRRNSNEKISVKDSPRIHTAQDQFTSKPGDLAMIVYTHSSLGQIKPVMLSHSYLARSTDYLFLNGKVRDDIYCSSLPLDNVIEFMTEICVFSHGGSIGYSCNPDTLFYDGKDLFKRDKSDLETLNPTFLLVRPYILERLRTSLQSYLNLQVNPLISLILTNVLYGYKKYWAQRHFKTPIVDSLFCSRLRKLFGSNLKYILCDGATDCSGTKDFFAFMLNIRVIELYGSDEAAVSLMSVDDFCDHQKRKENQVSDWLDDSDEDEKTDFENILLMPPIVNRNIFKENNSKNLLFTSFILCPTFGSRIRLEDWEDFRTSDLPYPRGRLVIGGDVVSKGYFKRTQATGQSFYRDSNWITWFRTDDIARVFPNGSFEIISGITDMVQMVDGQFISLSQIEHILRNSQFVDNVCAICGEDKRFVIVLVVPNLRRLALKSPGQAHLKMAIGTDPEPEELIDVEFRREVCNDRLLCEFISEHLEELIKKSGIQDLRSRFHVVPEIWTPETQLVTPSFEPRRGAIQKFYAVDIQSIIRMVFTGKRLSARLLKPRTNSNPTRLNISSLSHPSSRLSY